MTLTAKLESDMYIRKWELVSMQVIDALEVERGSTDITVYFKWMLLEKSKHAQ